MPYTEFTCRSGGSNLNAGTFSGLGEESVNPLLIFNSGTWVSSSRTFTVPVASGDPRGLGVATGCFVSLYDSATPPTSGVYVGRVISMTSTTILIHQLHCAGIVASVPLSANGATMRVGGAWRGPAGTSYFPFNFTSGVQLRNVNNNPIRINFKNDQTYLMATGIIGSVIGPTTYQGYATTFGDFGRATIQGPTASGNFHMVNLVGAQQYISDFNIYYNGSAGTANYQLIGPMVAQRILVSGGRGNGIGSTVNPITCIECVAIDCNTTNTASQGGFLSSINGAIYMRCVSIRNNRNGFYGSRGFTMIDCIATLNTEAGCRLVPTAASNTLIKNCDFYQNRTHGLESNATTIGYHTHIENCNFIDNSGAAWTFSGVGNGNLVNIYNCMVGSGIYANIHGIGSPYTGYFVPNIINLQSYPLDISPWVYATGGNFTPAAAIARDSGYCVFPTGLTNMFTGTVSYDNVGATKMRSNILLRRGDL